MKIDIIKNCNYQGREFTAGESVDVKKAIAEALIEGRTANATGSSGTTTQSDHDSE